MTGKPAVEARLLLEDPRYETWRVRLETALERAHSDLRRSGKDHAYMCQRSGEARALRFALGLQAEMSEEDPPSQSPDS